MNLRNRLLLITTLALYSESLSVTLIRNYADIISAGYVNIDGSDFTDMSGPYRPMTEKHNIESSLFGKLLFMSRQVSLSLLANIPDFGYSKSHLGDVGL